MSTSFDRCEDTTIAPSAWVTRWAGLVRAGGMVLDLAAGHGRHARWFADRGYRVTAVDVDCSGLADVQGRIEVIETDLETGTWPLAGRTFDGIVVANYLHRPHFPHLTTALNDGGVLIFETFGQGNERLGRPRNPNFLLSPGELLKAFDTLHLVAYEHGEEQTPRPAVRQRLCAVRGAGPYALQPR
ncbi:MAG: class I SAM-dependent methyltransferase [Croceibacterium sp.]